MHKIGMRVAKTMGVRMQGRIILPISREQYTDGQYRTPESHEQVSYVQWDDGTMGWIHSAFLREVHNV